MAILIRQPHWLIFHGYFFPVVSKTQFQLRQYSEHLELTVFTAPFQWFSLSLWFRDCIADVSVENPTISYSLHFEQLWLSVFIPICCQLLYRNKCLEYSKKFYWFRKMAVVISPVRCMAPPAMVSWLGLQYQIWVSSHQEDLKFSYSMYNKWKKYLQIPMK